MILRQRSKMREPVVRLSASLWNKSLHGFSILKHTTITIPKESCQTRAERTLAAHSLVVFSVVGGVGMVCARSGQRGLFFIFAKSMPWSYRVKNLYIGIEGKRMALLGTEKSS
jgi:hypothetical protein